MPVLRALIRTLVGSHDGHPACKICASQGSLLEQVEKGEQVIQIHLKNGYYYGPQFSAAAEFRAEPRNLAVAAELPCFRGISRNSVQTRKFRGNGHIP